MFPKLIYMLLNCIQTVELWYNRDHRGKQKILQTFHIDATARHMGEKKSVARISERFVRGGVVKAVKQMVQTIYLLCMCVVLYLGLPAILIIIILLCVCIYTCTVYVHVCMYVLVKAWRGMLYTN